MKHFLKPIPVCLLFAGLLLITTASVRNNDLFFQIKKQLTIFGDVYKEVATLYVDEVGPEKLMKRSIEAMLDDLDPYTVFIDEGEQQQMEILSLGSYGGIGIEAGFRGDQIVIIAPLEGYPAQRAGLLPGDIIEEINGVRIQGFTPEEVHQLTIGDVGTSLELTIQRPGLDQRIFFELKRERIEVKNITFADKIGDEKEFGYIQLARFGQKTGEEIRARLIEMNENGELKGVILDLRNNPGGLLEEAVELIDKFVEPGVTIVETRGRLENQNSTFATSEPALFGELPVIVLMNHGSASASEIVAGAFQDLDRAVVIGEPSFGKGLVQTIRPLSYNTSLKITVSKYYTPSGRSIQSVNYPEKDSGGEQARPSVPDSLRRAFQTKNGRTVYDGQGIEPDMIFGRDDASYLEVALLQNNRFFFFVHDLLTQAGDEEKTIPDDLFDLFASHLIENNFDFETPLDSHLEKISSDIDYFSEPSVAAHHLDELNALLQEAKIAQIHNIRDVIENHLHIEWISQTQGREARHRTLVERDMQIQKAMELLHDSEQYHSILTQ